MASTPDSTTHTNLPSDPFESVALTLSGGGFRASAFALGTLSFLHEVSWKGTPLLRTIKAISAVSGGTITGIAYAEAQATGKDFYDFYNKLYQFLQHDTLLTEALKILEDRDEEIWNDTHKRQTLINAFALSYSKLLTNENFDLFLAGPIGHLEEVIFNATEFSFAHPFRFQTQGWLGNIYLNANDSALGEIKNKLKLADILAASSCFPIGFEPILFPQDFLPGDDVTLKMVMTDPRYEKGVGLMDGGIIDNQGLSSIRLSQSRREGKNSELRPFSLVIITDVASPYLEKWEATPESSGKWRDKTIAGFEWDAIGPFPLKTPWYVWLILLISAVMTVISFLPLLSVFHRQILLFISTMSFTLSCAYALIMPSIKRKVSAKLDDLITLVPKFYRPLLKRFHTLRLGILERMIRERGSSAVSLLSDVFLKNVRRLHYNAIYKDKRWVHKRIGNFIYQLTSYDFKVKESVEFQDPVKGFMNRIDPELMDPGTEIQKSAEVAAKMGTTLWFEKEDDDKKTLDHLIACGQFNTCYNLLIFLTELEYSETSPFKGQRASNMDLSDLYYTLLDYWIKFKTNPSWMQEKYQAKTKQS